MKTKKELIKAILLNIDKTHNDKDKRDLINFSYDELLDIYNEILEMNK